MSGIRKGLGYADRPEHVRNAASEAFERELDAELGECVLEEVDSYSSPYEAIHVLECSVCGETCEHVNGAYPRCPHCGRKAVKR